MKDIASEGIAYGGNHYTKHTDGTYSFTCTECLKEVNQKGPADVNQLDFKCTDCWRKENADKYPVQEIRSGQIFKKEYDSEGPKKGQAINEAHDDILKQYFTEDRNDGSDEALEAYMTERMYRRAQFYYDLNADIQDKLHH